LNWTIEPYKRVGPLTIGQERKTVRDVLGDDYETFAKAEGENLTDAYDGLGVHLYYADDDTLEFVEFFEPAEVDFQGKRLLGRPFAQIQNELAADGYTPRASDVGYEYDELGIAFTLGGDEVEGVAAYRRGYYD
jgi:hypothetical protein